MTEERWLRTKEVRWLGTKEERWRRIKSVFQAAAERGPVEREAYLASETAGDDELRHEVEKMLRHATGAGVLDRPAWEGLRIEKTLDAGSRVGPYEIVEVAGAGGMGRVYKARDTRLGRTVAIKVLSAEFSHRLRIEGRAISSLNHPHVCALYDIGNQDGAAYLVMEYVEGESLAARLARGPLPVDDVIRYGAEIASALAAAHAQGIVHCDLKPANIMVTASGAKVLDFGVARVAHDDESSHGPLAGTAAYMSPSQLNGNPADARSDIFALGLVLYEMLTGTRHSAGTQRVTADLPAGLGSLIDCCLMEDATERVQHMDDIRVTLERLRAERAERSGWSKPARAAALLALAVAGAALIWRVPSKPAQHASQQAVVMSPEATVSAVLKPKPGSEPSSAASSVQATERSPVESRPATLTRASMVRTAPPAPPSLVTLASYPGLERDPSFSPDGTKVAFAWHTGNSGGYGIYVRPVISEGPPMRLTQGIADNWGPAWSPDGRRIAFRRQGAGSGIYWVEASGGPETLVAPIARQGHETLPQMTWSRDGKWIAAPDRDASGATRIYLFAVASGERRVLTSGANGTDHAPAFSPDGKSLAYASCAGAVFPCDLYVMNLTRDLGPKQLRRITDQGVYVRGLTWLPDGRSLVYSAGRTVSGDTSLWRVPVDPTGPPQRIDMAGSQARHPVISKTGGLLAYTRLGKWNLMMIQNFR